MRRPVSLPARRLSGSIGSVGRRAAVISAVLLIAVPLASCSGRPNSVIDEAGYHVRGDRVYFLSDFPGTAFQIRGADPGSFHSYDSRFAGDHGAVYFQGRPLPGADPATFMLLATRPGWAKDRSHVYHHDRVVSDDVEHFTLLGGGLAKDSSAVFWSDGSVVSDDPEHFTVIFDDDHYLFTKDANVVEVNGTVIAGAEPSTFRVLQGGYARDGRSIFYFTDQVVDADPATFEPLAGSYARDGRHAYWMGGAIQGADPASFRVLNANLECSSDSGRAYYQDTPIAGVDPGSFPPGESATGCTETSITFTH